MLTLDAVQTVEQTKLLYRHPKEIDKHVDAFQHFPQSQYYSRFLRWLDYFNQSFYCKHCVHYHNSVQALFEVWFGNSILHEQTGYEFDLSLQFYDSFFEFAMGSVIADTTSAKKLLVLSFIFSRYHGLMQNSLLHQFEKHTGTINEQFINNAIEHAFVKYETPGYLIANIEALTSEEIQLLMEALQGKNLRKNMVFPNPLSKHEFARLNALNLKRLRFNNQIALRGAIIVKLTKDTIDENILEVFLTASDTFQRFPGRIWLDIDIWKKAYELILEGIHGAEDCSITDCVDFLEYKLYQCPEPFSLKGRTSNSFFRLVAEWHGFVHHLDFTAFREETWDKSNEKDLQFYFNETLYQCKELHSGQMLYAEGQELNHCVITYTLPAKSKHCTIWSLKSWDIINQKFKSVITIEVTNKKVLQALGFNNRKPTSEELLIIKDWCERMDYRIDLIKNF